MEESYQQLVCVQGYQSAVRGAGWQGGAGGVENQRNRHSGQNDETVQIIPTMRSNKHP